MTAPGFNVRVPVTRLSPLVIVNVEVNEVSVRMIEPTANGVPEMTNSPSSTYVPGYEVGLARLLSTDTPSARKWTRPEPSNRLHSRVSVTTVPGRKFEPGRRRGTCP